MAAPESQGQTNRTLRKIDAYRLLIMGAQRSDIPRTESGEEYRINPETGLYKQEEEWMKQLVDTCRAYLDDEDLSLVNTAIVLTLAAHREQFRDSGDPYSIHPFTMALELATKKQADAITIASTLLHDTVEDTKGDVVLSVTVDMLQQLHREVAETVDGLTRKKHRHMKKEEAKESNRLDIIFSIAENPRIALIKIYDRLNNMRSLGSKKGRSSRLSTVIETRDIYIPLARLMGLYEEAEELEYLCLWHGEEIPNDQLEQLRLRYRENIKRFEQADLMPALSRSLGVRQEAVSAYPAGIMSLLTQDEFHVNLDVRLENVSEEMRVTDVLEVISSLTRSHAVFDHMDDVREVIDKVQNRRFDTYTCSVQIGGIPYHIHLFPQDIFDREHASIADLYFHKPAISKYPHGELTEEERNHHARGIQKSISIAEKLIGMRERDKGNHTSQELIQFLESRLPPRHMWVIGVDDNGFEARWHVHEGASVLDYAVSISPSGWKMAKQATVNGRDVPLSHPLSPNDIVHIEFGSQVNNDPVMIHSLRIYAVHKDSMRKHVERALRSEQGYGLYYKLLAAGTSILDDCLPEEERPYVYGIEEIYQEIFIKTAVAEVEAYLKKHSLGNLLSLLPVEDASQRSHALLSIGVGLGILPEQTYKDIMNRVRVYNNAVIVMEVKFGTRTEGQLAHVESIFGQLDIQMLRVETTTIRGIRQMMVMIAPQENAALIQLLRKIWENEELRRLGFRTLTYRQRGFRGDV